jgi:hypothetical protein
MVQSKRSLPSDFAVPNASEERVHRQLRDRIAQAGLSSFVGTIAFAGQNSSGEYEVQFNDSSSNTGYSSAWPQWAFSLAKDALLGGGKSVWLITNGDPFGTNLLTVLILA